MIDEELRKIKKLYGEDMMHLCRKMFPIIREKKGLLLNIILSNVKPTHSLAVDIIENHLENNFKNWIYHLANLEVVDTDKLLDTGKNPFELMEEAGYTLYECQTERDIQSFRKYWDINEELCTFTAGNRLEINYVFFAVKKNANEIKRKIVPERQDEYGTSVISIQFSRDDYTLGIRNRYNETVENPDATFSNNLENIIGGLTKSFQNYFGYSIVQEKCDYEEFLIKQLSYIKSRQGLLYRYNINRNGIYYCEDNIILVDGMEITKYKENSERYLVIDYFIVDMKERTIKLFDDKIEDSFINSIVSLGEINKMELNKQGDLRILKIIFEDKEVEITINQYNSIVGYHNDYIKEIDNNFLKYNKSLKKLFISNVEIIKDCFLENNMDLEELSLNSVQRIGNNFLEQNRILSRFEANNLISIGNNFLLQNTEMTSLNFPNVRDIYHGFMYNNNKIKTFRAENLKNIGTFFMRCNKSLREMFIPRIEQIGSMFLISNDKINVEKIFEEMEDNAKSHSK